MPSLAEISKTLTRDSFQSAICNIQTMTVDFKFEEAFGEPLLTSRMRWEAGPNTTADCLSRLTSVWIETRTAGGDTYYVKLSPEIRSSGADFGQTATESPSWGSLFCERPDENAECESPSAAKDLFAGRLSAEHFDVATESRTLSDLGATSTSGNDGEKPANDDFSLDSLLADAVDNAIDPGSGLRLSTRQLAEQKEQHARTAVNNVVTLIASSLAEFTTPARGCESDRKVANWVQARGTCELTFRSETTHDFLCTNDGTKTPIKATRNANINFETDLAGVSPVQVSDEGWAAVVLKLNDELRTTNEGDYKTNRWHFAARSSQVEDLKQLASSILTLQEYCSGE